VFWKVSTEQYLPMVKQPPERLIPCKALPYRAMQRLALSLEW
jgi:hypothetical protein